MAGVLLFAQLSGEVYHLWGLSRADELLLALAVGATAGIVLRRVARGPTPAMIVWTAAGGLAWVAAAYIGHSVRAVEQWGTQWWPSYFVSLNAQRTYGWDLSAGQALAGAVAGWGSTLPSLWPRQSGVRRRAVQCALTGVIAAALWVVVFRGVWVV